MDTLKTILDILVASGRAMYYGKGLCRCVKDIAIITIKIYNCTSGSPGSPISKEDIEDNEL